jgi:predicted anti-sigma-YlaC factor YlaD
MRHLKGGETEMFCMHKRAIRHLGAVALLAILCGGCSIKRIAVNKLGNALASSGTTFEGDNDPDLVGEALPFGLKLMESLLAESPRHTGLLLAVTSGFTEYSYGFVGQLADRVFTENIEQSNLLRGRARRLYLRARAYGMRAFEVRYPGFADRLEKDQRAALARVRKRDVPLLYWTAAAQGLAISASKDDPEMIAQLPVVEAFVRRAMELDPAWNAGALPEFMMNLEAARADVALAERLARIDRYYGEALRLSAGKRASVFLSYAENSCIPAQNLSRFRETLGRALRLDPELDIPTRLANLLAQRRASWLLSRTEELFLETSASAEKEN